MEYTHQSLVDLIWSRMKDGETAHAAAEAIHAEIAADRESLAAWWDALGVYWLKLAERDGMRHGPEPLVREPSDWTPPKNFGTSWRDRVDPLGIEVCIGNSGARKAAGDLTRAEVAVCADFHRSSAEAHAARQQQWLSVHNAMKDHERIRQTVKRRPALLKGDLPWVKRSHKDAPAAAAA